MTCSKLGHSDQGQEQYEILQKPWRGSEKKGLVCGFVLIGVDETALENPSLTQIKNPELFCVTFRSGFLVDNKNCQGSS